MKPVRSAFILVIWAALAFTACGESSSGNTSASGNGGGGGTETVTYTVTFDSQGGSTVSSQTVDENGVITDAAPVAVADSAFYRRRIADRDLLLVPAKATAAKPEAAPQTAKEE